jgi:putative ABC transport system permease protein
MLKSHLKFALRNLIKHPLYSMINLGGLSIGIAASFVLLIYSQREMSCDRQFRDAGRIVRIGTDFFNMGGFATSQPMLRDLLQTTCKEVQYATSLDKASIEIPVRLSAQERAFKDIYPYYTDANFFSVFSWQASAGSIPSKGLGPGEVILSESYARKFFGNESPVGKTLFIGKENTPSTVVAVLKDGFERSHLTPSVILPQPADATTGNPNTWNSAAVYNYVKLRPEGSIAGLSRWTDRLIDRVVYPASHDAISFKQWKEGSTAVKFIIQPLTDIYFQSDLKFELSPGGSLTQVRLLGAISIFLILLAIINYVNLVTARSSVRSREIGFKKTLGASRFDLARQILIESVLFSFLAMIIACGLIQVILFIYQSVTGTPLTGPIPLLLSHYFLLAVFSLLVGIISGIYPAFYLTARKSWLSIRSDKVIPGKGAPLIRNALVLVQFTIAAALIFVSFVIYGQLHYMKNKDKGFRAEGVVLIENADALQGGATAFQLLIEQQSQVISTSFCNRIPGGRNIWMYTYRSPSMKTDLSLPTFPVDDQYLSTMGMHLNAGRNFNRHLVSDTNSLILNESAVAALGLFDPIGATINGSEKVIGVVKDFNYASLKEKIGPVILRFNPAGNVLAIKVRGGHVNAFLEWLKGTGKEFMPDGSLSVTFLDDNFAKLAENERQLGHAITFFTILAILLATLGLTGLTLFTIERRIKEIGIRKVLGARTRDILGLMSKDFLRIVTIASLIALPAGWWLVHRWLENFAYRIPLGINIFFGTEAILLTIAFLVIWVLSLRAAIANPAKTLRSA